MKAFSIFSNEFKLQKFIQEKEKVIIGLILLLALILRLNRLGFLIPYYEFWDERWVAETSLRGPLPENLACRHLWWHRIQTGWLTFNGLSVSRPSGDRRLRQARNLAPVPEGQGQPGPRCLFLGFRQVLSERTNSRRWQCASRIDRAATA